MLVERGTSRPLLFAGWFRVQKEGDVQCSTSRGILDFTGGDSAPDFTLRDDLVFGHHSLRSNDGASTNLDTRLNHNTRSNQDAITDGDRAENEFAPFDLMTVDHRTTTNHHVFPDGEKARVVDLSGVDLRSNADRSP